MKWQEKQRTDNEGHLALISVLKYACDKESLDSRMQCQLHFPEPLQSSMLKLRRYQIPLGF